MQRKLVIDIGNTLQKFAVFSGKEMLDKETFSGFSENELKQWLVTYGPFSSIILSSVARPAPEYEKILAKAGRLLVLDENTRIPIKNLYETPETLGKDRLAAAIGAFALFPGKNVLSIDAGTCITYDFLTAGGEYSGGSISPGIRMRFRAMHEFTGRLPMMEPEDFGGLIGHNTGESLLSGVINGVCEEIKGIIGLYKEQYAEVITVITGGDHKFLHNKLKINIFAVPDLVLLGLNEILDCHDIER